MRASFLKETLANRRFIVYTMDFLSIPEHVIRKGRHHGHRSGKRPEDKENNLALNLKKRCAKRDYKGIHDRFLRDQPRPPPKISLKHDWMKELGSEVAQRPEGQGVQQSKSSQSSQPNPNPDHDRTGKPVVYPQRGPHRSRGIETRSFREEAVKHDRTVKPVVSPQEGAPQTRFSRDSMNFNVEDETNHDRTRKKPVVCRDANHEQSMLNEVDIDFRIPGLPHSVVNKLRTIVFVN